MAARNHGTIAVHSPELCDEIFGLSREDTVRNKLAVLEMEVKQQCHQKKKMAKQSLRPPATVLPSSANPEHVDISEDSDLTAEVDISDLPDAKSVENLCSTVLQNEQELLEDIDKFLKTEDSKHQCKREMLYQKWSKNVFTPIQPSLSVGPARLAVAACLLQNKLNAFMEGEQYHQLDSLRRTFFDNYLDYRNDQIDVFLDTVRPDVYNPQALTKEHSDLQKITTSVLSDPLVVQTTDWQSEGKLVRDCSNGYSSVRVPRTLQAVSAMGRQDTDCSTWLAMQFTDVDSEVRRKSRLRQQGIQTCSVINPAKWHAQEVTRELIKEEMNVPHKRDVPHHPTTLKLQ